MNLPENLGEHPFVIKVTTAMTGIFALLPAEELKREAPTDVLVAFSGGPDSCALLLALFAAQEKLKITLSACHINHGLRGQESDADEEFCQIIAGLLKIPLLAKRLDSAARDEATLRDLRYQALLETCNGANIKLCLSGHTLDDQAETVLFRLFRGSSLKGLTGIPRIRELEAGTFIARPLLEIRRADCVDFLKHAGVTAQQDSSNDDTTYDRNYIRQQIIPLIETRFPGATERIERTRSFLHEDDQELNVLATEALKEAAASNWCLETWNEIPLAIKRRCLGLAMAERGIEPGFQRIEQLLKLMSGQNEPTVSLSERWSAAVKDGKLLWLDRETREPVRELAEIPHYAVRVPGLTIMSRLNLCVRSQLLSEPPPLEYPAANSLEILCDLGNVAGELQLRARRPGDQIQPLGMSCDVRLKQYLHTRKDSKLLKFGGHTLVLADDIGVVWVPGAGLSERIAVRAHDIWSVTISSLAPDTSAFC